MQRSLAMISVVYCADSQHVWQYPWQQGMTVLQALELSGLVKQLGLVEPLELGIFGLKVRSPESHVLQAGDRVEIYRPLKLSPEQVRQKRAKANPVDRQLKGNQWQKKQGKNKNSALDTS